MLAKALKNDLRTKAKQATLLADVNLEFALTRSGKMNSRLSRKGVFACGIRRNFGWVSQKDFGKVVLDDISQWTVSRCEVKTGASLMASAWFFYATVRERFHDPEGDFKVSLVGARMDATNSGI